METSDLLLEYQKQVEQVYDTENLKCLSGLDHEFMLGGRPLLVWHNEVTRKSAVKHDGEFHYMQNLDDTLACSDELLYFTALLFLYRPHINNPMKDAYRFGERMIYPNFQNIYGKRYGMFADIASQMAYNFWDRVGDMLASFFPDKLDPNRVFFPIALDIVPSEFKLNENFIWLQNFRENQYKALNDKRKRIVHYVSTETDFKYKHLDKGVDNLSEMDAIQLERESFPEFYKEQISLSIEGYEKTLLLLEEMSSVLFVDLP
jgi:hypothetical protein